MEENASGSILGIHKKDVIEIHRIIVINTEQRSALVAEFRAVVI